MSIRNIDSELATSNLNDLFHLHRYDDCVLYINRLNHPTLKKVLAQLPIKLYLSRLPYTIEIFESLYAKIFIHEPDTFPSRLLQPERLIDKMVAYFSLLNDQQIIEPIDGDKMLDSFENVIRIISYIQPSLYSRLLFFKYACDRACLKFEKDLDTYKNLNFTMPKNRKINSSSSSFSVNNLNAYSNALIVSKASNMSTCEKVRVELVQTINNCHKALLKLNEYLNDLKSDKNLKKFKARKSNSSERGRDKSLKSSKTRSESVFTFKTSSQKENDGQQSVTNSTICQDFIQNRLYLNKSMLNSIEPYLTCIRIEKMMDNLFEKVNLDKEILLVFSHLKREDTYLNSLEPLQPLFRRYSLGFERCIQIWRKKCSADQLLLLNNPTNYEQVKKQLENSLLGLNDVDLTPAKSTCSFRRKNFMLKQNYLNTISASSDIAAKVVNGMDSMTDILNSNISINCYNVPDDLNDANDGKNPKFYSEINFYTNPSGNSTLPSKFKTRKRTSILNNKIFQNINIDDDLQKDLKDIKDQLPKTESTPKKLNFLLKNTEIQTSLEKLDSKTSESTPEYLTQIEQLKRELEQANENVNKLRQVEESLRHKLKETEEQLAAKKPEMVDHYSSTCTLSATESENKESKDILSDLISDQASTRTDFNNYQHTLDLINLYNNLNTKYRMEAYESLDGVHDMKAMTEFKIKLLFSVVVLSYRYVKIYIRDMKRKIKGILQIDDRSLSKDRSLSQKGQAITTPTIIVDKVDDKSLKSELKSNGSQVFFADENRGRKNYKFTGRYVSVQSDSSLIIEQAINKHLQFVTASNTFDLSRIITEVKEQLWGTLQEYPLRDCQELNSYINESVKTTWALVNHEPVLKLDYSSTKFDGNLHDRSEQSNKTNDQILNFVWPSLIDSSDNKCLAKGIVAT